MERVLALPLTSALPLRVSIRDAPIPREVGLDHVARGPRRERLAYAVRVRIPGQRDDVWWRGLPGDPADRGDPVELRHPHVEEGHLGPQARTRVDRREAVLDLRDDAELRAEALDQKADAVPYDGVVVGEEETRRHARARGSRRT